MTVREPSESEFKTLIQSPKCTVVDWFAHWCPPCKMISPVFERIASQKTEATFVKMDVDKHKGLMSQHGIKGMPTFQIFKGGVKIGELVGADPGKLEKFISEHVTKHWGTGRTLGGSSSGPSSASTTAPACSSKEVASRVGSDGSCSKLCIRLLNGERFTKSFNASDTLGTVRGALSAVCPGPFSFSMTYPNRRFTPSEESSLTLAQCGLVPNGTLMLSA
eukprot:TRINITY_DN27815_c0_g1_i1.p1 TRINITY_DN27815_c0_g1~~TRINITY_DN27815_c0_g1_i1.p1  ORF type:complete len:220 (+),score=29.36 TRINITY_DN27815_c0_g1_i1:62-721(+)